MKLAAISLLLSLVLALPVGTDPAATQPAAPGDPQAVAGRPSTETETEDEALEEFVPSEALSADTAVSFPVDI